jgi:hypothetical protein
MIHIEFIKVSTSTIAGNLPWLRDSPHRIKVDLTRQLRRLLAAEVSAGPLAKID